MSELQPGWLDRQFKKAAEDVKKWPDWMRKGVGLEETREATSTRISAQESKESAAKHKEKLT